MKLQQWWIAFTVVWVGLVVPIFLLALGFGGGLMSPPRFDDPSLFDITIWLAAWGFLLLPIWLLPAAVKR